MGILNATPDSFSDGGQYNQMERARERAQQMVADGADVLDIGGESTRPGASFVDATEEIARVIPIIQALRDNMQVPISIDTYKSEVARAALDAGATIINDVWGGMKDPAILKLAAASNATYILTHNREDKSKPCTVADVIDETSLLLAHALDAGIQPKQIWLDPGFGFGKQGEENLRLMHELAQFCQLGFPVVLGTSRKTFIRNTLNRDAHHVLEGSLATAILGAQAGCKMIRVHDVAETKRALQMTDAILNVGGNRHDG
jgi:dihydropteroate synthase